MQPYNWDPPSDPYPGQVTAGENLDARFPWSIPYFNPVIGLEEQIIIQNVIVNNSYEFLLQDASFLGLTIENSLQLGAGSAVNIASNNIFYPSQQYPVIAAGAFTIPSSAELDVLNVNFQVSTGDTLTVSGGAL